MVVNVYFSLGSNLGDREANILEALRRMDEAFGVHYSALSSLIETEPMGFSGGKFLNAAVLYRIPVPERSRRAVLEHPQQTINAITNPANKTPFLILSHF